jgi:predicted ester cyclase
MTMEDDQSVEENKALVRRIYGLCNPGEIASTYQFYAPGCIFHSLNGDSSVEQVREFDSKVMAAFPDISYTLEDMIAEGDKVAWRTRFTATHQGEFLGVAPTGKKIEMSYLAMVKIVDGKGVEYWTSVDVSRLMRQLGTSRPTGAEMK